MSRRDVNIRGGLRAILVFPALFLLLFPGAGLGGYCFPPQGDAGASTNAPRPRARDVGVEVGILPTGDLNAITDVPGVLVGHKTIDIGDEVRTGVTAILPFKGNVFKLKLPAAVFVGNGFGKALGLSQVEELGVIETPIVLTNTLSVPEAMAALVEYTLSQPGNEDVRSVNPVVAETNDGYLSNIRSRAVKKEDVMETIACAKGGPVEEGSVGAGRGTRCLGFKGGIGTSSRLVKTPRGIFTVGVLVQTNFGGILEINGAPVGRELGVHYLSKDLDRGSCIVVVATDAHLCSRNLKRVAKRAIYAMAKTGSVYSNGSGDYAIAFSVSRRVAEEQGKPVPELQGSELNPVFLAVQEATVEAIYNSLFKATTVCGYKGRCTEELPLDKVLAVCRRYNVLNLSKRLPVVRY